MKVEIFINDGKQLNVENLKAITYIDNLGQIIEITEDFSSNFSLSNATADLKFIGDQMILIRPKKVDYILFK